ncbi:MAG: hypothetical protein QGG42_04755 [Phycisphaerae bacterium]|jgi:hypothetical protein|nr:hypothetical protein [Phycisphaerae bacterium]
MLSLLIGLVIFVALAAGSFHLASEAFFGEGVPFAGKKKIRGAPGVVAGVFCVLVGLACSYVVIALAATELLDLYSRGPDPEPRSLLYGDQYMREKEDKAGGLLQPGDRITHIDGEPSRGDGIIRLYMMAETAKEKDIVVTVERADGRIEQVTIRGKPSAGGVAGQPLE